MKYCLFLLFLLSTLKGVAAPERKCLFEIGKQDGSASEYALYPNRYESFLASFGGEKSFYVGYSTTDKHWPYVQPGPLDSWGGGGYWAGKPHLCAGEHRCLKKYALPLSGRRILKATR